MIGFKLLLPPCSLCKSKRSVDNPQGGIVEECPVFLTGVGWGKLVQNTSKKAGCRLSTLAGLVTLPTRHGPPPLSCG